MKYLFFIFIGLFFLDISCAFAATDYLIVKDLPFVNNTTDLGNYLQGIFKLGIAVAVTLAAFMGVYGGMEYMFSDVPGVKVNAKATIKNAVWGLLLVFAAWLILNTIDPELVRFNFIKRIQDAADDVTVPSSPNTTPPTAGTCSTCAQLPPMEPPLTITASCGGSCQLDSSMIPKVQALNGKLAAESVSWKITEAWPSGSGHLSSCHSNGNCFDANVSNPTVANITAFQKAASQSGLRATYEVKNEAEAARLRAQGVSPVYVNTSSHFTAPHFHVTH